MTPSQVVTVCKRYASLLDGMGAKPVRDSKADSREAKLDHLRWMCGEIPSFLSNSQPFETDTSISGREKAMRWLGFVQGAFSSMGILDIEEMKDDNRPQEVRDPEQSQPLNLGKYVVERTDGSTRAGGKHSACPYFVLDLVHDKFSAAALKAYADACESEYPLLARDLRARVA